MTSRSAPSPPGPTRPASSPTSSTTSPWTAPRRCRVRTSAPWCGSRPAASSRPRKPSPCSSTWSPPARTPPPSRRPRGSRRWTPVRWRGSSTSVIAAHPDEWEQLRTGRRQGAGQAHRLLHGQGDAGVQGAGRREGRHRAAAGQGRPVRRGRAAAVAAVLLLTACSQHRASSAAPASTAPTSTTVHFTGAAGSPFCTLLRQLNTQDVLKGGGSTPTSASEAFAKLRQVLSDTAAAAPPGARHGHLTAGRGHRRTRRRPPGGGLQLRRAGRLAQRAGGVGGGERPRVRDRRCPDIGLQGPGLPPVACGHGRRRGSRQHQAPEPRGDGLPPPGRGTGDAPGHRHDRRRLGQAAGRRGLVVERGHPVQPPARPAGQAVQGRDPRRRRVPDRVHDHRRLRRHLDGPRGDAGLARVPGDHRRLGRGGDARRALRRAGHLRRLRQEPPRDAHGRGPGEPAVGLPLRRVDPPRPAQGQGHRHRVGLRGRRRPRRRRDGRRRARRHRAQRLPERGQLRGDVHGQHDGGGRRGHRDVAARLGLGSGPRQPPRRLRLRVRAGRRPPAGDRPATAPDHDQGGVRERHRRRHGPRRLHQRRAPPAGHRRRGPRRPRPRRLQQGRGTGPPHRGHQAARRVPHGRHRPDRRGPGGPAPPPRGRSAPRRLPDRHRQDDGREPGRPRPAGARRQGHPPAVGRDPPHRRHRRAHRARWPPRARS